MSHHICPIPMAALRCTANHAQNKNQPTDFVRAYGLVSLFSVLLLLRHNDPAGLINAVRRDHAASGVNNTDMYFLGAKPFMEKVIQSVMI